MLNKNSWLILFITTLMSYGQAWGNGIVAPAHPNTYPYGKPDLPCVIAAAKKRNIPLEVLLGVQSVERGQTGQAVRNTNATHDLGAFQINTIHLDRLAKYGGTKQDVLNKGCYNAEVASFLLAEAINHPKKQHKDFFTRAAGYHSWTETYNQRYKAKLVRYTNEWRLWLQNNGLGHLLHHY